MTTHEMAATPVETPISISRLFHTIRSYSAVILLAVTAVAIGYLILAIVLYLRIPAQFRTSQTFRFDFTGVNRGLYPNGSKFSPTEIVDTPILLEVFKANDLGRFTSFATFSQSVYILETNTALEVLASEYQARLADPKLSGVDRERLQTEFAMKRQSISRTEYSLTFQEVDDTKRVPQQLVRKVLTDVLATWARRAVQQRDVLAYDLPVLSPDTLTESAAERGHPVIAMHVLRVKVLRFLWNVERLRQLPSSELARTRDGVSLAEVQLGLEEIIRFRLEPLVPLLGSASVGGDEPFAQRFLQAQLEYEERQLQAHRARAETFRDALSVYTAKQPTTLGPAEETSARPARPRTDAKEEAVTPQLDESFVDRIVDLSSRASDAEYRQRLVNDYRDANLAVIPREQDVNYIRLALEQLRTDGAGGDNADAAWAQISAARKDARELAVKMTELYRTISRNLVPSTHLYSLTGPATARVDRAGNPSRLVWYGILVTMVSAIVTILVCLIHDRIRSEERQEAAAAYPG